MGYATKPLQHPEFYRKKGISLRGRDVQYTISPTHINFNTGNIIPAHYGYYTLPPPDVYFPKPDWFSCLRTPKETASLIGKVLLIIFPLTVSIGQAALLSNSHIKIESEKIAIYVLGITINSIFLAASCFFHCKTYGPANYCKKGTYVRNMTLTGIAGVTLSAILSPGIIGQDP